jgi:hypothetical protein
MATLRPNLTGAIVEGEDESRASAASSMDPDIPPQSFSDGGVVPGPKIPESRSKTSLLFLLVELEHLFVQHQLLR